MKWLLFSFLLLNSLTITAQPNDFILLKKNNKTIERFFAGTKIEFTTNTGAYVAADITAIKDDTLFLKELIIKQVPTTLGIYVLDTVGAYYLKYHYNEIKSIGKTGRRFDFSGSGASLMGGGIVLTVASGIVYLADNKKFSPELLGAAVALTGIGYLMIKSSGKGMVIGKKYSLVYVASADKKG